MSRSVAETGEAHYADEIDEGGYASLVVTGLIVGNRGESELAKASYPAERVFRRRGKGLVQVARECVRQPGDNR